MKESSIKELWPYDPNDLLPSSRLEPFLSFLMHSQAQIDEIAQNKDRFYLRTGTQQVIIISTLLSIFKYLLNQTKKPKKSHPCHLPLIAQVCCSFRCCLAQTLVYNHAGCAFCSLSPKVFLYFSMASLTIWQAFSLPSNWSTCTSLFSNFLQSAKNRCTWSSTCRGSCSISLQCDTDLSLFATEMILSSSSPWSIIRITPITFASTRHKVSTLAEQSTKISSGSSSSQQVCGMKPQFEGQWTALNSTRSSRSSPVSLSNSYLTLLYVGIQITAVTTCGADLPCETPCQGLVVQVGFLPLLIMLTTINTSFGNADIYSSITSQANCENKEQLK